MSNNVSRPWLVPGLLVIIALAVLALVSLLYQKYVQEMAIDHPVAMQRVKEFTKDSFPDPCDLRCRGMTCKLRYLEWGSSTKCRTSGYVYDCSRDPCVREGTFDVNQGQ